MLKDIQAKKGILLFMVLGMILIIVILAIVILNIISSQSRFTHHQVSRIQAYYAAQAGMNLAIERLRTGVWVSGTDCVAGCWWTFDGVDFHPASIVGNRVSIVIVTAGSPGCTSPPAPSGGACINSTAEYTYSP